MYPGADHECVEDSGVVLVDGVEGAERALQIFGVEPSTDSEYGAMDVPHVRRQVAGLPVIVVSVVAQLVVEKLTFAVKIFRQIPNRAGVQVELVAVFGAVIEG